jgi:hypothetical protein
VVTSTPFYFFSAPGHVVGSMSLGVCWCTRAANVSSSLWLWCIVVWLSVVVLRFQSNRLVSVTRVDARIQPGELVFFLFVSCLWLSKAVVLYFSCISMKHALLCAVP